jgi:hypothetical protein
LERAVTEHKIKSRTENPAPASATTKLTAMWGLSESALGGVLHAFKIPFRGMVMSSIAIVIISMIAKFSARRGQIIRSTFAVVLIKAFVSPHTPLTAYFSVFMQGLLGEVFFFTRRFKLLSSLLLGITVSLLNGFQKIMVLTVIYGQNLWKTIDDFYIFISQKWFGIAVSDSLIFSKWLIGGYILIHLFAGVVAGLLAYIIPLKVEARMSDPLILPPAGTGNLEKHPPKTKRKRWLKPSTIIIITLSVVAILLSYFYPETDRFDAAGIVIMLVRSFLIMALWFYVIAPVVRVYFVKLFNKKRQNSYAGEMNVILQLIPSLRSTIASSWESSRQINGIKRFRHFIIYSVAIMLKEEKE